MVPQTLLAPRQSRQSGRSSKSESLLDEVADEKHKLIATGSTLGRHGGKAVDNSAFYKRWKTFWTAFRYLRSLTPKQVEDFMASYVIYNLDWTNEQQMQQALGANYQEKVGDCLKAYYGVLNHLCALGDVEKMYIPPWMDRKATVLENQLLYEQSVAQDIGLSAGTKVLDLGCGRGRVAAHMSQYSGAHVTGLNIDPIQIGQAKIFNEKHNLHNTFILQDFNKLPLPFADESFDAFYQIQALSLCKNPITLFREIFRVTKPGAMISLLDWVSLQSNIPLGNNTGKVEYRPTIHAIRGYIKYSIIELALSLFTFALFVNSAILIIAGASLYNIPGGANTDLFIIHKLLSSSIAPAAGLVFTLALLLSGISASIVYTIAGQMVSESILK